MQADQRISSLQIRIATQADIEAIAAVLHDAFAEFEASYTLEALAATTPDSRRIRARWDEGPVWAVVLDSAIVGTVAAVVKHDSLYVRSMAVLPAARGRDIGRLLLERAEAYALSADCRRMFLSTTPFLTSAIKLYERFGFRRSDEGPRDLFGTPLFTMEKLLG